MLTIRWSSFRNTLLDVTKTVVIDWYCNTVVNSHFLSEVHGVVVDCYTCGESWKQVIGFFIEYGTVGRLEERIEHCMPAVWPTQATKTILVAHPP